MMSLTGIPPKYTPMIHAMPMASTPTLSSVTQLRKTVTNSAVSETAARFTGRASTSGIAAVLRRELRGPR